MAIIGFCGADICESKPGQDGWRKSDEALRMIKILIPSRTKDLYTDTVDSHRLLEGCGWWTPGDPTLGVEPTTARTGLCWVCVLSCTFWRMPFCTTAAIRKGSTAAIGHLRMAGSHEGWEAAQKCHMNSHDRSGIYPDHILFYYNKWETQDGFRPSACC